MITTFIVGFTVLISVLCFSNANLFHKLEFNAFLANGSNKQKYRFFTHAFVHGDWMHLFFNMYVLYSFGRIAEMSYSFTFGAKGDFYFVLLYLGGILFSTLPAFQRHKTNPHYNAVGASGAVSAVLFASILFNPMSKIYIIFIPVGIPAVVFGALYLALEYYLDKRGNDNIAHDAHLWGGIFGLVFTIVLNPNILLSFINKIIA